VDAILNWLSVIAAVVYLSFIIIFILLKEKMLKVLRKIGGDTTFPMIVAGLICLGVLYLLVKEVSISYIFMAMILSRILLFVTSMGDPYSFVEFTRRLSSKKFQIEDWFEIFIWVIISLGTLYENFWPNPISF